MKSVAVSMVMQMHLWNMFEAQCISAWVCSIDPTLAIRKMAHLPVRTSHHHSLSPTPTAKSLVPVASPGLDRAGNSRTCSSASSVDEWEVQSTLC